MIVKVTFSSGGSPGTTKLLELSESYDDVWEAVHEAFPGAAKIEWEDADGDRILIESQADLNMWLRLGASGSPSLPRWFVSGPTSPPPMVSGPQPTAPPSAPRSVESLPALTRPPAQEYVPRGLALPAVAEPPPYTLFPPEGLGRPQGNVKSVAIPRLKARFVAHTTCTDEGSTYAPGTKFFKTWRFRNDGGLKWPRLIHLIYVSKLTGDQLDGPDVLPITFPKQIDIGEEVDVTVPLVAPEKTGEYTGFWKLGDEGQKKFGQRVRVRIQVACPSTDLTERQSAILDTMTDEGWGHASGTIRLLLGGGAETAADVESALKKLGIRVSLND